jgi:hypothetical protein
MHVLLIASIIVAGLIVVAGIAMTPDIVRYVKISRM